MTRIQSQSFVVLLALARKPLTEGELRTTFESNPSELGELLDRLRKRCLISATTEPERGEFRQELCLTTEGERVLLRELEQMCELPEK